MNNSRVYLYYENVGLLDNEKEQSLFNSILHKTLSDVVERLCETINNLTKEMVKSITYRDWSYGSDLT